MKSNNFGGTSPYALTCEYSRVPIPCLFLLFRLVSWCPCLFILPSYWNKGFVSKVAEALWTKSRDEKLDVKPVIQKGLSLPWIRNIGSKSHQWQWRSQYRGKGGRVPPLTAKKIVKNREKERIIRKKSRNRGKIGKKRPKSGRFFHIAPPDK